MNRNTRRYCIGKLVELADAWQRDQYPLLRFSLCPLLAGRLTSVRTFYTLQPAQRLLLVLEYSDPEGRPLTLLPSSPVGFVTRATVAGVMEENGKLMKRNATSINQNAKRMRTEEEVVDAAEGGLLAARKRGRLRITDPNVKRKKRAGNGDDNDREIGERRETMMNPDGGGASNQTTSRVPKNVGSPLRKKKKAEEMRGSPGGHRLESECITSNGGSSNGSSSAAAIPARKAGENTGADSVGGNISMDTLINTPNDSSNVSNGVRSSIRNADSGSVAASSSDLTCTTARTEYPGEDISMPAAFAKHCKTTAAPKSSLDSLVIDKSASFMMQLPKGFCRGIVCLDVETVSDGLYTQFSQIGAVLSVRGQTFPFHAQVIELQGRNAPPPTPGWGYRVV
jgi:hypothetical protein